MRVFLNQKVIFHKKNILEPFKIEKKVLIKPFLKTF
jgi:hypothetical protein